MIQDPVCGMKGDRHCLEQYTRESWYKDKTLIVAGILVFLVILSYFVPRLLLFRVTLLEYFEKIGWMLLLGFLLGGFVERFVPAEYISHILSKKRKRTILYSVTLGFLMSACSHGILALAIEFHKKGASTPVVVSFLLASPWANLPITLILLGFFGLKALYIILGALLVAVITGLVFQGLERKGLVESNPYTRATEESYSVVRDLKRRAGLYRFSPGRLREDIRLTLQGAVALSRMMLWWILIGIGLSSLAAAFIPPDFFHHYMGPTFLGLLATLALATVMEVCSEGTAPLAFEIFRQTGAFGNAFVFLMAGVATDYTEIGLLWTNVGRKTALWLPIVTVPQVILLGILANKLF